MLIVKPCRIRGVYEITLDPHADQRGYFMRTYDRSIFISYGIDREWVQENHSLTKRKGTIRGLHFQFPRFSETKLIRVIKGIVYDVFVDLRKDSPAFGDWDAVYLTEYNKKMIYIPRGFAHGFCSLTDHCEVIYKVDNEYKPDFEGGIIWSDKRLNIQWPVSAPILSEKDASLPSMDEFIKDYHGMLP